jgi:hypothetical protein
MNAQSKSTSPLGVRIMRLYLTPTLWATIAVCSLSAVLVGLQPAVVQAKDGPKVFNGPGGGEYTIEETEIKLVDGPGNWIIWGNGQDVTITEKKDGDGSLTLRGFGKITINEKNGKGTLIIENDNKEVYIKKLNGPGNVFLRNEGKKKIEEKNGPGDVLFKHKPPIIVKVVDGPGTSKREE